MRKGWEKKRLSEVCEFKSGTTISDKLEKNTGDVLYAKVGDMNMEGNEDFITVSSRYVDFKDINKNQIIPEGAIIFPKRGGAIATNKKRRVVKPTIVDLNTMALIPRALVNKDYLFFWFKQIDLADLSNGTSIPQINNYSFDNVYISYPTLHSEQQQIVSVLDEAFAAIDQAKQNLQRNLQNAKDLFQSELNRVFENKGEGWEEKTLKEVCERITDGTHQTPKYFDSGVIFLSSRNVTSGKIDWNNIKYIDEKQHSEMQKRVCPRMNDILLAKNGTTGVAAIVDKDVSFDIYVSLALLRPLKNIIPHYMLYFINSPSAKVQFNKRLKGIGVPNLHLEEIREVIIPFPRDMSAQQKIVKQLDTLSVETKKLEELYQQKLNNLEELKKSILERAFRGELTQAPSMQEA